ncbi:MAG: hypothetical protein KDD63_25310 [Bacteroidetes bacterium]|nr:hypothetical protein [Bacteroidota bacterium]MCB0855577.1 hypothetical protein [Bacteroidota bacterium]
MSKFQQRLNQERDNVTEIKPTPIRPAKSLPNAENSCYGATYDKAGKHPISLAIDFFTKDGNRFGVFYMEIASPILFNLGSGTTGQTITLRASTIEVTIEGKNLAPVYEYLLEQRVVWMKELDSSFITEGNETVIDSIRISV